MPDDALSDRTAAADLAQWLQKERASVMAQWMSAVRADTEIPSADGLTMSALEDHLPELLDELEATLRDGFNKENQNDAESSALAHGKTRWRAGYRLDELIRELARVRQTILTNAQEFLRGRVVSEADRIKIEETILCFFDRVVASSARRYANESQSELILRTQQLRSAYAQVHAVTEQLRGVADSRLRLVRAAVHELSNSLHTVALIAHVLAGPEDAAVRRKAEADLQSRARQLRHLTDRLQQYSDVLGGEAEVNLVKLDLPRFVQELEAAYGPACAAKNIQLRLSSTPEPREVTTDTGKLNVIATVLIENAIEFTSKGEVCISTESAGPDRWIFQVEDTGTGIRPSDAAQIFSEYHRDAGSDAGGTGLGLLLARHFARLLDGEITFDSEPGRGSRFRVDLPVDGASRVPPIDPRLAL